MPRAAERRLGPLWLAVAFAWPLAAQNNDAPRAPRINEPFVPSPVPAPAVSTEEPVSAPPLSVRVTRRPPNTARLAPLPEQRNDDTEEIVVIGQGWRLPDLGSEWRARQQEAASADRFVATALPLYDPAEPPLHSDAFTSREQRRHGYIEIFRLRFGRRSRD